MVAPALFVVISIKLLMEYTLHKGAWVASDVFHEEELSRAACVNLLKTGGVRNAYDFDCHEAAATTIR